MNGYHDEIKNIVPILKSGGVLLYPTDTIWGLGCDVFNEAAVDKIFKIKKRAKEKGFVLLVSDKEMLAKYVTKVHPRIDSLNDYHQRPVTVIYNHPRNLPAFLLSNDGSIAIRIVKDEFCQDFISAFGKPIISTSANISGQPFPASFAEISAPILENVDHVAQYRQNETVKSQPSVIIRLGKKNEFIFIRK